MENVEFGVGLEVTLLATPMFAGAKKTAKDGFSILVMPADMDEKHYMSIEQVVEEVNKLAKKGGAEEVKAESITSELESLKNTDATKKKDGIDWGSVKFCLRQAFLYFAQDKDGNTTDMEFAFAVEVNAEGLLPKIELIQIKSLTMSIWSTKREKVLDSMGIWDVEQKLLAS